MSWVSLTGPQLDRLAARLGRTHLPADRHCITREPSWYRQGALLRLQCVTGIKAFIAAGPGDIAERRLFLLDGRSQPLHRGNESAGIGIRTAEDAADYLRFFCGSIHGEDSSFEIVDDLIPGWRVEGAGKPEMFPPRIVASGEPGLFVGKAWVVYDGALFIAGFAIQQNGLVEMTDDELVGPIVPFEGYRLARQRRREPAPPPVPEGSERGRLQ